MENTNKQEQDKAAKLNATQAEDETGFKRVPIDINDPKNQENLVNLRWYLGIANPVYEKVKVNVNVLEGKNKVAKTIEKSEFDHYEYPNVAGDDFKTWLTKSFGEGVKVDPKTKEVYTLVPENQTPTPQPNADNVTEEPRPQVNPQDTPTTNTNDPDNN